LVPNASWPGTDGKSILRETIFASTPGSAPSAEPLRVPETYPTIQMAIDAAKPGDLIDVAPRHYRGAVVIDKSITVKARVHDAVEPRNNRTVIDGGDSPAVTIASGLSPPPNLIGFELRSAGDDGVLIRSPARIQYNHIVSGKDLLQFDSGGGGIVRGNVLEGSRDDAIDINHPNRNLLIESNRMLAIHQDGIEVRLHDDAKIAKTALLTIRDNQITGAGQDGIQIIDYHTQTNRRIVIERNLIHHNARAAIGLMDNEDTTEDYRAASIRERIHVFHNNLFQGNAKALKGVNGFSKATHNLFWHNQVNHESSNVDAATSIYANPLLDTQYRLAPGSPAIDAGTADVTYARKRVMNQAADSFTGKAPDIGWKEAL
jgi:Right handed beta helix region